MTTAHRPRIAFLTGHPRSGSTLLATRLAHHSQIHTTAETHFMDYSAHGALLSRLAARLNRDRFVRFTVDRNPRLRDLSLTQVQMRDAARTAFPSRRDAFASILAAEAAQARRPVLLEKTPRHLEFIPQLIRWFPDAPILIMIRDGRDAVLSLLRVPWASDDPIRHAAHWIENTRAAHRYAARWPDRVRLVRYEDMLSDPRSIMGDVCRDIGVDFEDGMLTETGASSTIPAWEAPWKAHSAEPPDPAMAARWRTHPDVALIARLTQLLQTDLIRCGYPVDESLSPPTLTDRIALGLGRLKHRTFLARLVYLQFTSTAQHEAQRHSGENGSPHVFDGRH
ncbi:MAG: sulfotransferase [Pseudomonadota bacterium]